MDPNLSEIVLFAGTFAPRSYEFCQGQQMSISANTALFSLIGTTYGGDGQNTFNLPDLRGRVPVGAGIAPGMPAVNLGEKFGNESVTLNSANMPAHTHVLVGAGAAPVVGTLTATMNVNTSAGGDLSTDSYLGVEGAGIGVYASQPSGTDPIDTLNAAAISFNTSGLSANLGAVQLTPAGGATPVSLLQPFLVLNYIIAVEGIFPSRN